MENRAFNMDCLEAMRETGQRAAAGGILQRTGKGIKKPDHFRGKPFHKQDTAAGGHPVLDSVGQAERRK